MSEIVREEPDFRPFDVLDLAGEVKGSGLRLGTSGAVVAWISLGQPLRLEAYGTVEAAVAGQAGYQVVWREVEAVAARVPAEAGRKEEGGEGEPKKKP